ncbi:hypothetical protein [Agreia pratensis]|uniref:Uncharacterized protein n=1 Tax=Agreia pratensis TaxID=150121 RepID=A0A1X7K2U8_9MICO|nr:hypothetical protein [Agreia pratensis]SMG34903.1 hypothetical protein SAMN06296010_1996 [Agreia pratensis]
MPISPETPIESFRFIESADGSLSGIDEVQLDKQVREICAHLIVLNPGKDHPASALLAEISRDTKSPDYTRLVVTTVMTLIGQYLLLAAHTFVIPIAQKNINHMILTYRLLRPVEEEAHFRQE